ncbi:MAG: pyruvate, water dikinase regulatory protein [Chloroflexota bacterium]
MEFNPQQIHIDDSQETPRDSSYPPLYVVSGNIGALGEQAVRTVLPQFHDAQVPVIKVPRVRESRHVESVVSRAVETGGIIVHTLVNTALRQQLNALAAEQGVAVIDLVGPLLEALTEMVGQEPQGKPGLYRFKNQEYFKRIDAIAFTLDHDDGKNYQGWPEAEIVLTGPSRLGKTPLGVYLSVMGWKVANVPLTPRVPPRPELFALDRRRVIGLTIDPAELLTYRQHRQSGLGAGSQSDYSDPLKLYEELEAAQEVFRQGRFKVIDVTNKPIETTAGQVITAVTRQLKTHPPDGNQNSD